MAVCSALKAGLVQYGRSEGRRWGTGVCELFFDGVQEAEVELYWFSLLPSETPHHIASTVQGRPCDARCSHHVAVPTVLRSPLPEGEFPHFLAAGSSEFRAAFGVIVLP